MRKWELLNTWTLVGDVFGKEGKRSGRVYHVYSQYTSYFNPQIKRYAFENYRILVHF